MLSRPVLSAFRHVSNISALTTSYSTVSSPVRVGFIGAGEISGLHALALKEIPGAELAGLWSRSGCSIVPDPAAKAREYGAALYDSAEQLIEDPSIDAVFVLTNYETHLQYATMALQARKPVLVEKPVANGVEEMEQLRDAAVIAGVPCVPVHNYIHEPHLLRTKMMIEQGKLGRITAVYICYNIHHPEEVCARLPGVLRQIGTHHAYTSLFLLGEKPKYVSAFRTMIRDGDKGTAPQENLSMVNMQMESGALCHMEMSFAADDHSSDSWSFYIKVAMNPNSPKPRS